jgi:hypothetical protein
MLRLMAFLRPVVQSRFRFDQYVFHASQFRYIGLRCRIAACRMLGSALRPSDSAPQQVRLTAHRDEHFVKMPRAAKPAARCFPAVSKVLAELVAPAPDRLVRHDHACSNSSSSMSRKSGWKRKYQHTARVMTPAGKR